MKKEKRDQYLEQRLRIIAPLVRDDKADPPSVRQAAACGGVSEATVKRWLKRFKEGGLEGLAPGYKGPGLSGSRLCKGYDEAIRRAVEVRRQDPRISVSKIIMVLESENPSLKGMIRRSTLQRLLQKRQCARRDLVGREKLGGRKCYGRFRKEHRMDQVQCDVKVLPECRRPDGGSGRLYLQMYEDDFSRKILSWETSFAQDTRLALSPLRGLIERYGRPASIYTDNGSIYRSAAMRRACDLTGVRLKFARPYAAASKGMIERRNGMANDVENQIRGRCLRAEAVSEFIGMWIERHNSTPSSALGGLSPNAVFDGDSAPLQFLPQEILETAFSRDVSRTIDSDGTVSIEGISYQADLSRASPGERVVFVISQDGRILQVMPDESLAEIHRLAPKPDVDPEVLKPAPRDPAESDPCPAYMAAEFRNRARAEGSYSGEEEFMEEFRSRIGVGPQAPAAHGPSPYSVLYGRGHEGGSNGGEE